MKNYLSFTGFCSTKPLAIFLFCLLPALLAGQVQVEWINVYPMKGNLEDGVFDHEGNLILVGTNYFGVANSNDLLIRKIDPNGNTIWQAAYDSAHYDEKSAAVCLDIDDNIYVTGADYYRGFTFKYSKTGSLIWKNYVANDGIDNFCDSHSNIYVVAQGIKVIWKYDSAGALIDSFEIDSNSIPYHIQLNETGDIFIGGTKLVAQQQYFFAEKHDSDGILQWHTPYFPNDTIPQYPWDMVLDNKSNLYIVASAKKGTEEMYFAIKYKPTGIIDWTVFNSFGNTNNDHGRAIAVDQSSNLFLTGFTSGSNGSFCFTVKYDSSGSLVWIDTIVRPFPGPHPKISTDKEGNVYILTSRLNSDSLYSNSFYFSLKKLNNSGDSIWQVNYPFTFNSSFLLFVDSSENIFVSCSDSSGDNIITIKYSQPVGISSIGSGSNSLKLYPNPFHTTASIQMPLFGSKPGDIWLEVYDVPGKLIRKERIHQAGNINFNRGALQSGMYILKLISDHEIIATTKMVIQ